jgi:hypothetical protein
MRGRRQKEVKETKRKTTIKLIREREAQMEKETGKNKHEY